jgi:hypothetical protein
MTAAAKWSLVVIVATIVLILLVAYIVNYTDWVLADPLGTELSSEPPLFPTGP